MYVDIVISNIFNLNKHFFFIIMKMSTLRSGYNEQLNYHIKNYRELFTYISALTCFIRGKSKELMYLSRCIFTDMEYSKASHICSYKIAIIFGKNREFVACSPQLCFFRTTLIIGPRRVCLLRTLGRN